MSAAHPIVVMFEFLALLVGGFLSHDECHLGFNAATLLAAFAAVMPSLTLLLWMFVLPNSKASQIGAVLFSFRFAFFYAAIVTVAHGLIGGWCNTVASQMGLAFVLITFPLLLTIVILSFVIFVAAALVGMPHIIAASEAKTPVLLLSPEPAVAAPPSPAPAPDRAVSPVRAASPVRRRSSRSPRRRAH
jgi:hypothetical protein